MPGYLRKRGRRHFRKKEFSRTNVGHRVGTGSAKTSDIANYTGDLDTRVFYQQELTGGIVKTTTNSIEDRQRDMVNLRGFKMCMTFRNNTTSPLYLNMAIVAPKETSLTAIDTTEFFRWVGGTSRSRAFGTSLTAQEFRCLPINVDKFTVLKHKRYVLNANTANTKTFSSERRNWREIRWWQKLNRQIRYDATTGQCETPVFVCYWLDQAMAPGGATGVVAAATIQEEFMAYWREPKN